MNLRFRDLLLVAALAAGMMWLANVGTAWAVALKVWAPGETIRASDLNANFAALNAYTGLIKNDRIAADAAISHTKLATPALIPKAYAQVSLCTSSPCTVPEKYGFGNVTRSGAGTYTAYLSPPRPNVNYAVFVTPVLNPATARVFCQISGQDNGVFNIGCFNDAGGATDVGFNLLVMDTDN